MSSPVEPEHVRRWGEQHGRSDFVVFTNGVFDLLHPGHLEVIRCARRAAGQRGIVVVGANSDESTRRIKGIRRPIQNQDDRIHLLEAVRDVDLVFMFHEDDPQILISRIRPDVIVRGGDHGMFQTMPDGSSKEVLLTRRDPRWSTTQIIRDIVRSTPRG
jgi:D-beta-D-heptose 7-phosphate kinase/D-beta-D-heptose 1-phosphate adenosyltransferase